MCSSRATCLSMNWCFSGLVRTIKIHRILKENIYIHELNFYHIVSVCIMVSVLASSEVDRGFKPLLCQITDYKLVFVVSPLSTQH
jgi:hypothetical protein